MNDAYKNSPQIEAKISKASQAEKGNQELKAIKQDLKRFRIRELKRDYKDYHKTKLAPYWFKGLSDEEIKERKDKRWEMCLKVSLYERLREYFVDYQEDGTPDWNLLSKAETIYKQIKEECPRVNQFISELRFKRNSDELYNRSNF